MWKYKISLWRMWRCLLLFETTMAFVVVLIYSFHGDNVSIIERTQMEKTRNEERIQHIARANRGRNMMVFFKHLITNCTNGTCKTKEPDRHDSANVPQKITLTRENTTCPLHLAQNDTWFSVNSERVAIIFSAYYLIKFNSVFIIGVREKKSHFTLKCLLWFLPENTSSLAMMEVPARETSLPDNRNRYRSTTFKCSVPPKIRPTYVSIVTSTSSSRNLTNLFKLKYIDPTKDYNKNFTVCLTPLNFNYSRAYEMVEWIELNRILGADKFVIYNYSSAMNIEMLLNYYSKLNLVEVVQWKIPLIVDTWPKSTTPETHYFGQLAALQDCLYRNKQESKFIVNVDVDEVIIPRGVNMSTWADLIQTFPDHSGAFIFRNVFFRKEWNDTKEEFPDKDLAKKYQLVSLLKTKHEMRIQGIKQRTKYIARTSVVDQIEVHDVVRLVGKVRVPIETGLLHHYRNWLKYDDPENVKVEDNIVVRKYAKPLIENVANLWKMLPNISLDMHTV